MITASIVSHNHGHRVEELIELLDSCPDVDKIVLTRNLPEDDFTRQYSKLVTIENPEPQGFSANHNNAFSHCKGGYFCVLNPDISFTENPFPALLDCAQSSDAALVAPLVLDLKGNPEDSIRHFPTLKSLVGKLLVGSLGAYDVGSRQVPFAPDWVAGMFMLFRRTDFAAISGFDSNYYLYYEDVDICARLWHSGKQIIACPQATVTHDARRESRRSWRFRYWHLLSLLRYLSRAGKILPRSQGGGA